MDNMTENVIEFVRDQKRATVTFSQGRFISRVKKLAEERPEDCQITAEKGINGNELAQAAGVSQQAVSQVLNGQRRGTTKVLGAICKALELSVKDVLIVED